MASNDKLRRLVAGVLKTKARTGKTTKNEAVVMSYGKMINLGGPTKFGIGAAAMQMALKHIIGLEVLRQFRMPLTERELAYTISAGCPADIRQIFVKLPHWIALGEGIDALRQYALLATPDEWALSQNLKYRKAIQTENSGNIDGDVSKYLQQYGFPNLEAALRI